MGMTMYVFLPMVGPDFGAVGGSSQLRAIVGALLTYGLITAVLMVVVCAATWAVGSAQGSWPTAGKATLGRTRPAKASKGHPVDRPAHERKGATPHYPASMPRAI